MDLWGPYASAFGAGMTAKEFELEWTDTKQIGMAIRRIVEGIADGMGYSIIPRKEGHYESISLFTRTECLVVEEEGGGIQSAALDRVIPNGDCSGVNVTVLAKVEGDIDIIVSYLMGIIPEIGYFTDQRIRLLGLNEIDVVMSKIDVVMTTVAPLLHRVRDMMSGELEPGFHNFNRLKWNRYWNTVDNWSSKQESSEIDKEQEKKVDL